MMIPLKKNLICKFLYPENENKLIAPIHFYEKKMVE